MKGADITNIILSSLPTDNFADTNGLPSQDSELGGTNNIIKSSFNDTNLVYQ
jgi:hypothetical protein